MSQGMKARHHQVEGQGKFEGVGHGHDDQWRVDQVHVGSERQHVENVSERLHVVNDHVGR